MPLNAMAVDSDYFSSNDILFYEPPDTACTSIISSDHTSPASETNQDIAANFFTSTVFSGNNGQTMNAVQVAAIMGNLQQDSGFNPNAGEDGAYKGIAQWSSPGRWDSIADPKNDINNQLNFIKTELDGAYKDSLVEFWNASSPDDLNKATYAVARNYEVATREGRESSSTAWTNNTDAANNVLDMLRREEYASSFYDEFGSSADSGYETRSGCGGLASGGMSLLEAKQLMQLYKNLEPNSWDPGTAGTIYNINGTDCSGGPLANCVAFSQYFINRYTTKQYTYTANGSGVVSSLIGLGFTDGGHTPKVYSVFSQSTGSMMCGETPCGHTGVVLGIDTNNNKIIIGEAACGNTLDWADAREYDLVEYSNDAYTYAYTDNFLEDSL
jgi:hypothetical protein